MQNGLVNKLGLSFCKTVLIQFVIRKLVYLHSTSFHEETLALLRHC